MFYRVLIEPQTESAGLLQSSRSHSEAATIIECVIGKIKSRQNQLVLTAFYSMTGRGFNFQRDRSMKT